MKETDLYGPIKAYLVAQGYAVKGEIDGADVVARRGDDPPVIVELKTRFSLALFHQATARLRLTDAVYVAVPRGAGRTWARTLRDNRALARRLGLGLITVRMGDGRVEVHADPGPYRPRTAPAARRRLLREFERRVGDPTPGGATRVPIVTAYRQDALRCAAHLAAHGPCKGARVAAATGAATATRIMAADHYGWFERVSLGVYALTPAGHAALDTYAADLARLAAE
ncbi:hypothetical protein DXV76_08930 [Rhodobacteraceae bacterium CCMM004]|nr:hypothetical protein DXV76_08930 [Rhodobacteraceae bacterium CCMM004]